MNTSRKFKSIFIIFVSIIIGIIAIIFNPSQEKVTAPKALFIDDATVSKITASRQKSATLLTSSVYFDGQPLIYDSDTNTFYYSLVEDSVQAYTPEVLAEGVEVNLYGVPISEETIERNTPINLLMYDENSYWAATLSCTTLPMMDIRIDEAVVNSLGLDDTYDLPDYTGSSVYLFDNRADFEGKTRAITSDAKVKRHGQSTINYPMKGYRISLLKDKNELEGENNKENFLGLRKDDDWILSATYRDYEKIRNVFATNLWYETATKHNEWKVNNSTKYAFVELFFNGHYHGLYGLCYRLDAKEFGTKDGESAFKKKDWSMSELDTELTDNILPGYQLKAGDESGYADLQELYMNMNYSIDPAVIRRTSDVGNSIDLWLYYKLSQAVDNVNYGNAKNMYVSVKNSESGIHGHKLLFVPWDMDQSFRYVSAESGGQYNYPEYDLPLEWGTVYRLQYTGDATINTEIKARYKELRNTVWSEENMRAMLATYEKDIYDSGAFARTREKFKDGAYNDSGVKLSEFTNYVIERLAAMDTYIDQLP